MSLSEGDTAHYNDILASKDHFKQCRQSNGNANQKFLCGPKNPAKDHTDRLMSHSYPYAPINVFTNTPGYLYKARLLGEKEEVRAVISDLRENVGQVLRNIYISAETEDGVEFTKNILPDRLPASLKEMAARLGAKVIGKYPSIIDHQPLPLMFAVIDSYIGKLYGLDDEARPRIESILKTVKDILSKAVSEGRLPVGEARLIETIGKLRIHIQDPLTNIGKTSKNVEGICMPDFNYIALDMSQCDEELVYILLHEIIHSLEGHTYVVDPVAEDVRIVRGGLRFKNRNDHSAKDRMRFNWLNEAMTELMVNALIDRKTGSKSVKFKHSYYHEKVICAEIFSGLPDMTLVVDAYFEDYDESKAGTAENLPAWKKLHAFIAEKYGSTFLVDLDDFIRIGGAEVALITLRKFGARFPEVLKKYFKKYGRDGAELKT